MGKLSAYGLLLLFGMVLFTGCAATAGRFAVKQDDTKKSAPVVVEKKTEQKPKKRIDNTVPDSLYTAEEAELPEDADDDPYDEQISTINAPSNPEETKADLNAMSDPELQEAILVFLNTKYKYGGTTLQGIDCSAFTMNVFKDRYGILLKRSAREQYTMGIEIEKDELIEGDLVFFNTSRRAKPGHVGIYIGNNRFVHAGRTKGVSVSTLDETYYFKRYMGARRIVE